MDYSLSGEDWRRAWAICEADKHAFKDVDVQQNRNQRRTNNEPADRTERKSNYNSDVAHTKCNKHYSVGGRLRPIGRSCWLRPVTRNHQFTDAPATRRG
jgi:hypothetical protein